jgi:DNA polymerase
MYIRRRIYLGERRAMNKRQAKNALLRWYKVFGVDHVFCSILRDPGVEQTKSEESKMVRLSEGHKTEQSMFPRQESRRQPFDSIEKLREAVFSIDCPLKRAAKNTVFSDGTAGVDVMIIGEAPGKDEDDQGKPFVGQSGKLLNLMLGSVGLKRSDAYISNVVFWRPPGNRQPSAEEVTLCLPYVIDHIILARPKVLFLLGGVAIRAILNTNETISSLRGRPRKFFNIDVIATFHPAYLLRSPGQKSLAFRDCIRMKTILESEEGAATPLEEKTK